MERYITTSKPFTLEIFDFYGERGYILRVNGWILQTTDTEELLTAINKLCKALDDIKTKIKRSQNRG